MSALHPSQPSLRQCEDHALSALAFDVLDDALGLSMPAQKACIAGDVFIAMLDPVSVSCMTIPNIHSRDGATERAAASVTNGHAMRGELVGVMSGGSQPLPSELNANAVRSRRDGGERPAPISQLCSITFRARCADPVRKHAEGVSG